AQRDRRFRDIVNGSALSLCDTVGVLTVARRRGAPLRERVTGVELIERVCARAAREGISVYFLGGEDGVAADAAAVLEVRFPGLHVAGTQHGYFENERSVEIAERIRASGAHVLFVGLGSPRQEYWLAEHLDATGCGVGIGVGGSFDVIGGRIARAPRAYRQLGLEWFYRLVKEPHRWRRQLALPYFVWLVALESFGLTPKRAVDA
ncbi:MAG: WecB/TagA/CpsF family glycosyltransferase, partial [Candidatus Eremiobacteraeota bacterium]|nr:WecB/TagA/CpsF family glycosyltransferase [Candidatus Eremiobacteraeota bacterium]